MGGKFRRQQAAADTEQLAAMEQAAGLYQEQRPYLMDARMNALQQGGMAFNPVNEALSKMYGPGAQTDVQAMLQQPMAPEMMELGEPTREAIGTKGQRRRGRQRKRRVERREKRKGRLQGQQKKRQERRAGRQARRKGRKEGRRS